MTDTIKIKVCKDWFNKELYEHDKLLAHQRINMTFKSNYRMIFEEEIVNKEKLIDYINKGYSIKINC